MIHPGGPLESEIVHLRLDFLSFLRVVRSLPPPPPNCRKVRVVLTFFALVRGSTCELATPTNTHHPQQERPWPRRERFTGKLLQTPTTPGRLPQHPIGQSSNASMRDLTSFSHQAKLPTRSGKRSPVLCRTGVNSDPEPIGVQEAHTAECVSEEVER